LAEDLALPKVVGSGLEVHWVLVRMYVPAGFVLTAKQSLGVEFLMSAALPPDVML
jgi:hypothetical protein